MIGSSENKLISGGERKRTAIGVEIITDPSLILLDEPTSGMDSLRSTQIVKLLNKLARAGKTIISTIHQPNSASFSFFDHLILMVDGEIAYQGRAKDSTRYFKKIGYNCMSHENPADYLIKIISCGHPKTLDDEKRIDKIKFTYHNYVKENLDRKNKEV